MKDKYTFPAVVSFDDDGIGVEFPDIPGCFSCPGSVEAVIPNASEALSLHLYNMEDDGDPIPEPSDILTVQHEPNQAVIFVDADMKKIRAHQSKKSVNIMVTIPETLAYDARNADINFSQTLQEALMHKLGINTKPKRRR